jgi:hypothetical protein
MKQRRLDEVLEECLTACLAGRRTVEESLSLYPSLSDHIEPLLRTALSVADSFQDYNPPSYVRERGLQRFLASARARTRARALTRDMGVRPATASWGLRQWGFLGSGIAAAVSLVLITGVVMSNGSGGDGGFVFNRTPEPTASRSSTVRNFTQHVDTISAKLSRGQDVAAEDITRLTQIASQIGDPSTLDQASQSELANSVPNAIAALQTIDNNQSSPEVREALSAANELKGKLVPEFSPGATVGPGPSGQPTQTPAATPPPAPTATPAPATAAPTPNDQSPATPGPTTDARGVDTFSQPLNINPLATPAKEP